MLRLVRSIDIPKRSRVPFWQDEVCPYLRQTIQLEEDDWIALAVDWPHEMRGHNMVVGRNEATSDGVRRAALSGRGLQTAMVAAPQQFVIPTGGGYFFVPSLNT